MKYMLLATAICFTPFVPATAQASFDEPVTAKVLPGWVKKDGNRVAALFLRMAPGWKTYWRAPGDAGIPPSFDWSGSSNLQAVAISWPAPQVFDQNGMRSIGYENDLIIPLAITPSDKDAPVRLSISMGLGICSDICVPYELDFDATLETEGRKPTPVIAAALAQRPFSAGEAGVTSATCRIEATSDGLRVEARVAMPHAGGDEVVVIEPGLDGIWVSEAQTRREGREIVAVSEMMHVDADAFALDRSAIRITVLGSAHAVDIQGCTAG